MAETLQWAKDLLPHWCVSRPGFCSQVLVGWTVLEEVLHHHVSSATGAGSRLSNVEFGEHMVSESSAAGPQSHHNYLVRPGELVPLHLILVSPKPLQTQERQMSGTVNRLGLDLQFD